MTPLGIARKPIDFVVPFPTPEGFLVNPPQQYHDAFDFCFVEGFPVAILGQSITPHSAIHLHEHIVTGSPITFCENVPIVRFTDLASSLHKVALASDIVYTN